MKIENAKSIISLIEFGVPQGSILRPLLFLLYLNDLPKATNLFTKLYADDTFLCAQNSDLKLLESEMNLELEKVYNWMCSNRLTLNISKSKSMINTKNRNILPMSIKINNTELEQCNSYKYLGVIFDKDLTRTRRLWPNGLGVSSGRGRSWVRSRAATHFSCKKKYSVPLC